MLENAVTPFSAWRDLHHARARFGRLEFVTPDRVVHVDPERQLLLRDDLGDRGRWSARTRNLRRLRLIVRVPWRSGPSDFINRHCGLHCGIRRRSDTSAHTLATGALMSICACNSGAAIASPFGISVQTALCATGSATHGATLPQKDRRAKDADAEPGDRDGPPVVQGGHRERQHHGDQPARGDHHDHRPRLEQRGGQGGRFVGSRMTLKTT